MFYIFRFLNRDLVKHKKAEKRVYELVYEALKTMHPLAPKPVILEKEAPERPTVPYIILTILALGIFIVYWVYVVNNDWNKHVEIHEKSERWLLDVLEKHYPRHLQRQANTEASKRHIHEQSRGMCGAAAGIF